MADNNSVFPFKNCCCCFSLRTGSIIIACLSLIGSAGSAAMNIYKGVEGETKWLYADAALDIIQFVLACILIYGIHTEQERLMKVWVVGAGFLLGLGLILAIVVIILTSFYIGIVLLLVMLALQIYFLLVVLSYALSLTLSLPVAA